MRRIAFVLISAVTTVVMGATAALADSPHFQFANNSISTSTGTLTTSFKEVGLGTGASTVQVNLTVDTATAVYQCFNNGGNHPKAGNKETVQTALSTTGNFPVRNGQTTASLSVGPPGPGNFSCPSGQSLFLQSVTYSGTNVSNPPDASNQFHATPDPISTGPIHVLIG